MVKVQVGNIFDSDAQTLVNTVNCVGVMGKGIALEYKKRFPAMYADYVERCNQKEVRLGVPYLYKSLFPPYILNFPTKDHWRSVSLLEDIIRGLEYLVSKYKDWGIASLAVPPLGCGEGQLEWKIVGPTLYRYLSKLDIPVDLYAPFGTPSGQLDEQFLKDNSNGLSSNHGEPRKIKVAWLALVEILRGIESQPYHWPVGRTTFQKIAFVATNEGLPTGLKFEKGSYGPYSSELKQLLTKLINNGLVKEHRNGRMFEIKVGPTYQDAYNQYNSKIKPWDEIIKKTIDLFMRIETKQAEITATVIFALNNVSQDKNERPTEMDVLNSVMSWKQKRRPPLKEETVANTIRNLAILNWLDVTPSESLPTSKEYDFN